MSDRTMETLQEIVGTLQRAGMLPAGAEIDAEVTVVDATDAEIQRATGWHRALVTVTWRALAISSTEEQGKTGVSVASESPET